MNRPAIIYVLLAAFFGLGVAIDWLVWDGLPPRWTWNDVTQMIGVIVLCLMWESADAAARNGPHRRSAVILTILLPPVGTTVYFFQSRPWQKALVGIVLFWSGILAVAFLTDEICYRLIA